MMPIDVTFLLLNGSTGEYSGTSVGEEEGTLNSAIIVVYKVVSPIIFVFVILALLWYIVMLIFR